MTDVAEITLTCERNANYLLRYKDRPGIKSGGIDYHIYLRMNDGRVVNRSIDYSGYIQSIKS